MAMSKLYAGVALRELRQSQTLTQKEFAARLGISISYLNQMENNNRPLAASLMVTLAQEFGFDIRQLSAGEAEKLALDMREALADLDSDLMPSPADLSLVATNAPLFARAFLAMHRAQRQMQERVALLDEAIGRGDEKLAPLPWEEVRDFFHYCDNYIDVIDRTAEQFSTNALEGDDIFARAANWLETRHGIETKITPMELIRHFDGQCIQLSQHSPASTRLFQLFHQIALIEHRDLIEATLDWARFRTDQARDIARIGLANYFAGATMLPYERFLGEAHTSRHDLDILARRFGASIEQIAQRLSTLQRPGNKGVPFFFARVDQAGTITKRHSATSLQFARFGGACPLWNVHRAFERPSEYHRQLAETPDGKRYFCLAKDISKNAARFGAPHSRYAMALGCEVVHAPNLVYCDGLDASNSTAFEPIGISCRICPRRNCHQRAMPPLEQHSRFDLAIRGHLPYEVDPS